MFFVYLFRPFKILLLLSSKSSLLLSTFFVQSCCFYHSLLSNFQFICSSVHVFLSFRFTSSYSLLTLFPLVFSQISKYFLSFFFDLFAFCSFHFSFLSSLYSCLLISFKSSIPLFSSTQLPSSYLFLALFLSSLLTVFNMYFSSICFDLSTFPRIIFSAISNSSFAVFLSSQLPSPYSF